MDRRRLAVLIGSVCVVGLAAVTHGQTGTATQGTAAGQATQTAQAPAQTPPTAPRQGGARGGQRSCGRHAHSRIRRAGEMIFREAWTRAPMSQPITQENLGNQNLTLHIYGDATETAKPITRFTTTPTRVRRRATGRCGERQGAYRDATGGGKVRFKTQNTGYRFVHVVVPRRRWSKHS